ncbi:SDR family oxidoreductase [Corynebacterium anserum]|uniref:dTDP-4-dehydrorhamnose reductase n=1 Tax=Corynebacterium anserum TaxID=2684406 RepID=A0A7G7YPQ2_9CORY|nr:sugar nucleotide-binding protein [Corynebacterium anserum]MBC2682112.1 sugar nucleotide-binding protein [Corynebacterium anserum]QNH96472.1 sugar nucleotide-binding protein [Corynebacterium anserum]
MELLVTGAHGQVGRAMSCLVPTLRGLSRSDMDLAGNCDLSPFFPTPPSQPTVVVNLAAFTNVDGAQSPDVREEVYAVNGRAPGLLAQQCTRLGIPMIHVSTDYVFSGRRKRGETNHPTDPTEPINEYGRSKLQGEKAVLEAGGIVVRTSWVYTGPANTGRDFVRTMADLADRGVNPSVVDDQWGRPTYAPHLAAALCEVAAVLAGEHEHLVPADLPRVLHCAGSGDPITWCDLAQATFAATGHEPQRVTPITSAEYPVPAPRPVNSALSLEEWVDAGLQPLPAWQDGLIHAVE